MTSDVMALRPDRDQPEVMTTTQQTRTTTTTTRDGRGITIPVVGPFLLVDAVTTGVNVVWVVASLGYAVLGGLTTLGVVWTVLQAVVVGAFAAGQVWLARKG